MKLVLALGVAAALAGAAWALGPTDNQLTNDNGGGYVSAYTLATGNPYTDTVLTECSSSRGRENEPAVEIDPRNSNVVIGSSNDYRCVSAGSTPGHLAPTGPTRLG